MEIQYYFYSDKNRKNIRVAWCDCGGTGNPVLLVHGFGGCFPAWNMLRDAMGGDYHFYILDVNGIAADECGNITATLSPYEQSGVIRDIIRKLRLDNLLLIGHSMGAAAAAMAAAEPYVGSRVEKLVLLSPLGLERTLPEKLVSLSGSSPEHNFLLRNAGDELTAFRLLSLFVPETDNITDDMIHIFSGALSNPGERMRLSATVHRLFIPDTRDFVLRLRRIKTETLILWGNEDRISSPDNAAVFRKEISRSTVRLLPGCGHLIHLESPAGAASWICRSPGEIELPILSGREPAPSAGNGRLKLRRLFDRWTPGTLFFLVFLKFLQLLRKCGLRAEENGWRKATGIFMSNEYSKFILSCFRLKYSNGVLPPSDAEQAKRELVQRLRSFLQDKNSFHWTAEPGFFTLGRKKIFFCDIIAANYALDGKLLSIEPFWDDEQGSFAVLSGEQKQAALAEVVRAYNRFSRVPGQRRSFVMKEHLRRWAKRTAGFSYAGRAELRLLLDRLMTAAYLHCSVLPADRQEAEKMRLRTPNIKKYRHPGWGLLNIFCRFTAELTEADLWVQFHHVPVDGAQMQELMARLRQEWGCAGQISFPALSQHARPEIFHCGGRLFRARFHIDFSKMLALRKELNSRYREEMGGNLTMAGMILWGLARHPFFAKRKMLFPVDMTGTGVSGERELSMVFIRPDRFSGDSEPLQGFLKFQAAFNRMIAAARAGKGESTEFLNLCSMVHPLFYHIVNMLMPDTLREIVGTVGVSILKDAEIFTSPLSDFQSAGFMAIGRMDMPAGNGRSAGAVTVCATRRQVRYYITAMTEMASDYRKFLKF